MIIWLAFLVLITIFLAIDLGVFNREAHEISYKEATKWTIGWTTLGLLFSGVIYLIYKNGMMVSPHPTTATQSAIEYLTGYIIELTLSIDNIFVIAMIFKSFRIPKKYQHRVLFWGIIGALLFRGIMIAFGVILIEKFTWTTYIFDAFLIYTAIKMAIADDDEEFDPKSSFMYKMIKKIMPVTSRIDHEKFIVKRNGLTIATPLLLALILIEFTDILFALDSIPAILGITTDPFIVFTSNIFAILGLRSMYFFVANMLDSFHYLKYSLTVILTYVGIKLILANHYHLSIGLSLLIILISILGGIYFSLKYKKEHPHEVEES
ncbi:MAG: TerC family protein [Saprospiraceae bacterium]|nr:TerC family protein [Saprospiraceae bacterium]